MTPQEFSLRECISGVLARYRDTETLAQAQFYFNEPTDSIIHGDRSLFETMMAELINNAVEAAPKDSQVVLSIQNESGLRVEIENPGAGIDEKLVPHIFERFRFVDGIPLIGLDLPLAQRIAKMHGAEISIRSEKNSGNIVVLAFADSGQHFAAS
ncbi:MAG: sensor histidine kinase [Candidatus Obscuribacterales bacterium]|nr:sensor histidine kinase [Candidatus Obscuribacterales bacterium]